MCRYSGAMHQLHADGSIERQESTAPTEFLGGQLKKMRRKETTGDDEP